MKKPNKSGKGEKKEGKKKYKVRNWRKYNQMLVNRGSIFFWIEQSEKENWNKTMKTGKRGKPKMYSDSAVQTCLTLRYVFRLTLRGAEGFVNSLFKIMELNLISPDYSTLSIRSGALAVDIYAGEKIRSNESLHIVVDSSGAKVYGEGEWKVRQHGWSKRRAWKKFHLGIDEKTKQIKAVEVTENSVADCEMFGSLLKQIQSPISQVSADGAYDKKVCYDLLQDLGITVSIPPQKNARIWKHGNSSGSVNIRDRNLRRIREIGREKWKEEIGYHRRSIAENAMFRFKTIFGDIIASRVPVNQRTEVLLKCRILNLMTEMGMPDSYVVA